MASLSIGVSASLSGGLSTSAASDVHPFTSFQFQVEINVNGVSNQVCAALFSDVDGLEMNIEPKTIREGGNNVGPVHMAGGVTYGQLTLKRGMTTNFELWKWFEAVAASGGGGLRGDANITMLSGDGTEQAVFALVNCLPIKLKAPALNAKDGVVAIEEMSILYESLTLVSAGA